MLRTSKILMLAAALASALAAQADDPLWLGLQKQAPALSQRLAGKVKRHMDCYDGKDKGTGSTDDLFLFQGWKGDKPQFKAESHQGQGELAKDMPDLADSDFLKLATQPETLLAFTPKKNKRLSRLGDETLEGRPCAIFEIDAEGSGIKGHKRIWIEKNSGLPLQVDLSLSGMGVKSFHSLVRFHQAGDGAWTPAVADSDMVVSMLFISARLKCHLEFLDWIGRNH
jgi:hypothetical protein